MQSGVASVGKGTPISAEGKYFAQFQVPDIRDKVEERPVGPVCEVPRGEGRGQEFHRIHECITARLYYIRQVDIRSKDAQEGR